MQDCRRQKRRQDCVEPLAKTCKGPRHRMHMASARAVPMPSAATPTAKPRARLTASPAS